MLAAIIGFLVRLGVDSLLGEGHNYTGALLTALAMAIVLPIAVHWLSSR